MKILVKKSVTIFFIYTLFCLMYLVLASQSAGLITKTFVVLINIGKLLGVTLIINLLYFFTISKDGEERFVLLKNIYKLILILILLNFLKLIAGFFVDEINMILFTLFNNEQIVEGIIHSLK